MKKIVEYYCKFCKDIQKMKVTGPVKQIGIYWLKCSRCKNNWHVRIEELESLVN
jgi:hypothetical protein